MFVLTLARGQWFGHQENDNYLRTKKKSDMEQYLKSKSIKTKARETNIQIHISGLWWMDSNLEFWSSRCFWQFEILPSKKTCEQPPLLGRGTGPRLWMTLLFSLWFYRNLTDGQEVSKLLILNLKLC